MSMIRKNLLVFVGVIVLVLAAGVAGLELSGFDILKKDDVAVQKRPGPKGQAIFNVVSAEGLWPKFVETEIDPLDVHVGDIQKMRVMVEDDKEIASVVAHIETDNGTTTVPLELVSRRAVTQADLDSRKYIVKDEKLVVVPDWKIMANSFLHSLTLEASATGLERFEYAGEWTVRDTHSRKYQTIFVAKDELGRENYITHAWSDPCAPPMNGAWNVDGNCSFLAGDLFTTGVENGDVGFAGAYTLTISSFSGTSRFVWNPGYTFNINNSGQVSLSSGSPVELKQTYLWVTDADADLSGRYCYSSGEPGVCLDQVASDTNPGSKTRRGSLAYYSAVDCLDTNNTVYPGAGPYPDAANLGDHNCDSSVVKGFESLMYFQGYDSGCITYWADAYACGEFVGGIDSVCPGFVGMTVYCQ